MTQKGWPRKAQKDTKNKLSQFSRQQTCPRKDTEWGEFVFVIFLCFLWQLADGQEKGTKYLVEPKENRHDDAERMATKSTKRHKNKLSQFSRQQPCPRKDTEWGEFVFVIFCVFCGNWQMGKKGHQMLSLSQREPTR